MQKAGDLPYYPRFILNCSDGNCFTTADIDEFEYVKEVGTDYDLSRFKINQKLEIQWVDDNDEQLLKKYKVSNIEIHQIKRDIDEPTYGMNMNDCSGGIAGRRKKHLMEIYIFLDSLDE